MTNPYDPYGQQPQQPQNPYGQQPQQPYGQPAPNPYGGAPVPPPPTSDYYYGNTQNRYSGGKIAGTLIALAVIQIILALLTGGGALINLATLGDSDSFNYSIAKAAFPNYETAVLISLVVGLAACVIYIISVTAVFRKKKMVTVLTWLAAGIHFGGTAISMIVLFVDANDVVYEVNAESTFIFAIICSGIILGVQGLLVSLPASRNNIRNDFS